jgi:hypothetical protein
MEFVSLHPPVNTLNEMTGRVTHENWFLNWTLRITSPELQSLDEVEDTGIEPVTS